MANKVSALIANAWNAIPSLPKISRDNISAAAQAALKQLPWVVGTAVSFGFIHTAGTKSAWMAMGVVVLTANVYNVYYFLSSLSSEEKAAKICTAGRTAIVVFAFFFFGYTTHLYYSTALLLKNVSTVSTVSALLQNVCFGKIVLDVGLVLKNLTEDEPKLREKHLLLVKGLTDLCKNGRVGKLYAAHHEMGAGLLISIDQMFRKNVNRSLFHYLRKNPDNFEKAVALFPVIFDHASICAQWDELKTFKKVLGSLDEQEPIHAKILDYFEKKYRSPLKEDEINQILTGKPDLKSLREFFNKFVQLKEMLHPISSIQFEGLFQEQVEELCRLHDKILPSLHSLKKLGAQLIQEHIEQFAECERTLVSSALDDLGLSVGDYISNFSSRRNLIVQLHRRSIYCLGDLKRENIVGNIEKKEIITRMRDYLTGKSLDPLPDQSITTHSKAAKVAAACFNITLTGATLATQFAFAPVLTSLGVVFGFDQGEKASDHRFHETSLTFPMPWMQKSRYLAERLLRALAALHTATHFGKACALMEGVNQGGTLRSYFNHVLNKY